MTNKDRRILRILAGIALVIFLTLLGILIVDFINTNNAVAQQVGARARLPSACVHAVPSEEISFCSNRADRLWAQNRTKVIECDKLYPTSEDNDLFYWCVNDDD